jgi:hypothetical protein
MKEKSNIKNSENDFEKIIGSYSDDELKKVLKKRKLYQKEAADFAIQEAIRREIIYSEQDLFASEFKHETEKFSFFPSIEDQNARNKYIKSITRSFIVIGVIPLLLGGIRIFGSLGIEPILMFIWGASWSIVSFRLYQSLNIKLVYVLMILLVLVSGYMVKVFAMQKSIYSMDILVAVLAVGFIWYLTGFLKKLLNKQE